MLDDFNTGESTTCEVDGRVGHWSITNTGAAPTFGEGFVGVMNDRSLQLDPGGSSLTFGVTEAPFLPFDGSKYIGIRVTALTSAGALETVRVALGISNTQYCNLYISLADCLDWYEAEFIASPNPYGNTSELVWNQFEPRSLAPSATLYDLSTIKYLYELRFVGSTSTSIDNLTLMGPACANCFCGDGVCDSIEYSPGPPPNLTLGDRRVMSPAYCAADCPLVFTGCPTDNLGSRIPVSVSGNTSLMTGEFAGSCGSYLSDRPPHPAKPGYGTADAKYIFTAPSDGTYRFNARGEGDAWNLYVLDGACEGPELACALESVGSVGPTLDVALHANQFVTVVVDGSYRTQGTFTLDITKSEDECPNLRLASVVPLAVNGTMQLATNDSVTPSCASPGRLDYTYHWTAPAAGRYGFLAEARNGSLLSLVLQDGDCAGAELACTVPGYNPDAWPARLSVGRQLAEAQDVAITVEGDSSDYSLSILQVACPAFDLGARVPLTYTGSIGPINNVDDEICTHGYPDTALTWTAPAAGTYTFEVQSSAGTVTVALLDGVDCGGRFLDCHENARATATFDPGKTITIVLEDQLGNAVADPPAVEFTLQISRE